jgi:monoamine oxidase
MDRLGLERGSLAGKQSTLSTRGRWVSTENPVELVLRSKMSLRARVELAVVGLRIKRAYKRIVANNSIEDSREFRALLNTQPAAHFLRGVRTAEVQDLCRSWTRGWIGCEPEDTAATQFVVSLGVAMEKAAKVPNFSLPVGGNQALVDALAASLGDRLRLSSPVRSIVWSDSGVVVEYVGDTGPVQVRAQRCVVATPADAALALMPDLPEDQRDAFERIGYGRYILGAFFTSETGSQRWDGHYSIGTPGAASFQSIFNHAAPLRGSGARRPGGALVVFSGGARADELMTLSDQEIEAVFTRDLLAELPELEGKIDEFVLRRHRKVVPYWAPGDHSTVRALRSPVGPIHFAGDYIAGIPSMADAAASGVRVAGEVLRAL